MGGIIFNHRRCRLAKLLPHLTVVESGFDVVLDLVVVGLSLDNRQPSRLVGLGL